MAANTRHVVNMANSIIGVSILSMPYCFKEAGLVLGVLMVLLSGIITKKTCMFLVRAATMARHRSYEFLAFHVFGVRGKLAVEVCMILFLIGICISFYVVMGDLAPAIAARVLHIHNTPALRATLLLGIAVLVVLPLCLLRKLDNLASMSACSILFYIFLITVVMWHAFPRLLDGSWFHMAHLFRPSGVLQVFPICMLGLSCQSNVFEIYDSVPDPDVPKMRSVVNHALNLCCALYIAVGFFGYIAFVDQDMAGNLIMNFPASPLTEGIKLFFTASLAISFPLMIFPCRTSIHSLMYRRNTQGYDLVGNYMPEAHFKAITVGILAVSLVVGIMVPNIEFVLGVLGSTMGVIISLVLPSIMFIKVNTKTSSERLVAQGIMLMGVLVIVTGTYLNLTHTRPSTAEVAAAAIGGESAGGQEAVIAVPPPLLNVELRNLLPEKEADIAVPRQEQDSRRAGAGAVDSAPRRQPVAPDPPLDEAEVVVGKAEVGQARKEPVAPEPPPDEAGVGQARKEPVAPEPPPDEAGAGQARKEPVAPEPPPDEAGAGQARKEPVAPEPPPDEAGAGQARKEPVAPEPPPDEAGAGQARKEPVAPEPPPDEAGAGQARKEPVAPEPPPDEGEVALDKIAPVKAALDKAAPAKAAPAKAAPVKAAPVKAAPVKASPVKAASVKIVPAKAAVNKIAAAKTGGRQTREESLGEAEALHPDAIQKEEKETRQERTPESAAVAAAAAAAAAGVEELLQKMEVHHQKQQEILAEQKQILQELKEQKAQQLPDSHPDAPCDTCDKAAVPWKEEVSRAGA